MSQIGRHCLFAIFITLLIFTNNSQAIQKEKEVAKPVKSDKPVKAIKPGKPIIWRDPGDVAALNLAYGAGGPAKAPKPPFAFIEENLTGSNPKVHVSDADGVKWSVKFGAEVQPEIFATRLAWAVGYFVEPAYYVASGTIDDLGRLTRARDFIKPDGSFTRARFERHKEKGVEELKDAQSWSWVDNPFIGTKELNGLKVILMLVSNWDNKDVRDIKRGSNTAIYQYPHGSGTEDHYLVSDWGGSMGKWGGFFGRGKWDCKGFAEQTRDFVKGIKGDYFVFGYSGQHTKDFSQDIRISDMRWLIQYLGQITDEQLRAGLQASGAAPEEVACFTRSIRERINQIKNCV
jgi:hypothetical protein